MLDYENFIKMEILTLNTEAIKGFTDEQFFQFCVQNRDVRIERDRNKQIFIMPPTYSITGDRNAEIIFQLKLWNHKDNKGIVFDSSAGFTLPDGAMRSPDTAWISKERWEKASENDKKRFAHICPDFIIELRSETDHLKMLQDKMEEWIDNGCRLAWLIDFKEKKVYVYRNDKTVEIIDSFDNKISGEDVLSGFELDLNKV